MSLRLMAGDAVPPPALHAAFVAAFADYLIGPFTVDVERWPRFLARQAVDLALSRVALDGDEVRAFALVAPRGARWRLATMGATPAARGSGAAPALLDDFIARARAQARQAVELEVFAQNERAVRLYRGRDFAVRHALHAYRRPSAANVAATAAPMSTAPLPHEPLAIDRAGALAWLDDAERGIAELPLQVTSTVLAALDAPWQAWRRGRAQVVFSPSAAGIVLHSLVDRDPKQHDAQALLQALIERHPAAAIDVPPLQRADVGGDALLRLGFERKPLHQWLMACAP